MTKKLPNKPTSGSLDGNVHYLPIRVYYEDTDAGGVVYHANFLKYMERARTDFLRLLGIKQSELINHRDQPMIFVVRSLEIDYLKPARLDQALMIETRPVSMGAATLTIDQVVRHEDTPVVRTRLRVASLDKSGQPRRIPSHIREKLQPLLKEKSKEV